MILLLSMSSGASVKPSTTSFISQQRLSGMEVTTMTSQTFSADTLIPKDKQGNLLFHTPKSRSSGFLVTIVQYCTLVEMLWICNLSQKIHYTMISFISITKSKIIYILLSVQFNTLKMKKFYFILQKTISSLFLQRVLQYDKYLQVFASLMFQF